MTGLVPGLSSYRIPVNFFTVFPCPEAGSNPGFLILFPTHILCNIGKRLIWNAREWWNANPFRAGLAP